jgi:hypothetical protein
MKLIYRGVIYDYNPPHIDTNDLETVGQYRGRPVHFHQVKRLPNLKHTIQLMYRGARFRTESPVL